MNFRLSGFFQVFSRNNDRNGNPYRLTLFYYWLDGRVQVTQAFESRSSTPNICGSIRRAGWSELPGFHLSPSEYNATKKQFKHVLEYRN